MTRRPATGSRGPLGRWACIGLALAALGAGGWWLAGWLRAAGAGGPPVAASGAANPAAGSLAHSRPGDRSTGVSAWFAPGSARGDVAIAGRVLRLGERDQRPAGSVEVVFRGATGDATTTTRRDGGYAIRLPRGNYGVFVRDAQVMSIGRRDPTRLPGPPLPETAGVPDEGLMLNVTADRDLDGVDLPVIRGAKLTGRVIDSAARPIAGAMLRAIGNGSWRPVLATDLAESAADGSFELRLVPGGYEITASHPRFAGVEHRERARYIVGADTPINAVVVMTPGCVITGRVATRSGERAGDGALERMWGASELEFAPAGRIDPDGSFSFATTDEADITLRAWPWKSPPSSPRQFACRSGARFDNVVFTVIDRAPDVEGVLVDAAGQPVGFGFIDVKPLDPGGISQQERTDAAGRWQVFSLPHGRYRLIAYAEGHGFASTTVVSPRDGVRIELGGTGRLEGTTPRLASGSFELALDKCADNSDVLTLPQSRRLVTVTGGRFSAAGLPACDLTLTAIWRGRTVSQQVAIPAGGAARLELELGEPRQKTVRGMVRNPGGTPISGAVVSVQGAQDDSTVATTVTSASGAYVIKAFSGAKLSATSRGEIGYASVGGANVDAEQVDLVIGDSPDDGDAKP